MPDVQTVVTGIAMGEYLRWHEDLLWFADWGAGEIIAVNVDGASEVVLRRRSIPLMIDWPPEGRMLLVSGRDGLPPAKGARRLAGDVRRSQPRL